MENKIEKKETYTIEEKKAIMEMLNKERKQKDQARLKKQEKTNLNIKDKKQILNKLTRERRDAQLFEQMEKKRVENKKIYIFHNKEFYKIKNLERDYYFKVEDYEKLSHRPKIVTIYHDFLGELKKKDILIQIRRYSDKIFISDDLIKVYYKSCYFEGN